MFKFTGKTLLITGASSGIGRETAIQASKLGANLVLIGRNVSELESTMAQLKDGNHVIYAINFSSDTLDLDLKLMFKALDKIDGLFHCAGVHATAPLKVFDAPEAEMLYKVNVLSVFSLLKELRKKNNHNEGCSVVLMSSASALVGEPAIATYASSKSALQGMVKSLASELVKDKMRVNSISAGIVKTEMTDKLFSEMDSHYVDEIQSKHPLGFGEPEDVACAALYLLSNSSKWVTGTNLVVDGGYTNVK